MLSDAAVRDYLERLVPLQEDWEETRDGLTEIKRDARSDGLNLDAINAVLLVLSKYPHDKGAHVLNEVIRYAEAYGTENLVSQSGNGSGSTSPPDSVPDADVSPPPKAEVPASTVPPALARLRLSTQVVAAMFVTFGLLWLLN